jgi:hypothetical protein
MNYGLRKGLEDIAGELKGIRNILATMWHSRYRDGETNMISPEVYADEYISTEECAARLGVSDQTIRNWILAGKKRPDTGWTYGIHYVNINPAKKKPIIRIPWNNLIRQFSNDTPINQSAFYVGVSKKYSNSTRERKDSHVADPTVPKDPDFENGFIQGY